MSISIVRLTEEGEEQFLSDWRRLDVFQEELDQICTRGICILDDAVLRKLLSLKIYVLFKK